MNFAFLNGRRIFITGGTGFVGSHLLPLLADAGASVIVLIRPTSDISHLPPSVKTVQVSLTDSAGLSEAIRGSDTVIHMAALLFGLGWQDYLSANARAAASLAEACSRLGKDGPRRFIHVSSLSAAGPCCTEEGVSEADAGLPVSAYGWSKRLAENILRASLGDRLVIVRPPIIYGSGDRGMLPVYKGLQKGLAVLPGLSGKFPVSAMHVRDVAQAIMLCCQDRASGVYHLNDGRVYSMKDIYLAAYRQKTPHSAAALMVHGAYSGPLYGSGLRCQKARSETRPKLEHRQVPRSKTVRLDRIERPYFFGTRL